MGREIRRVPPGWEHPENERGHIPLLDGSYEEEARDWLEQAVAWEAGTHPDLTAGHTTKEKIPYFWEWDGNPPDKSSYQPAFTEEPTHYQVYENVSEGTPTSPVFATLEEVVTWLVEDQGHSENAVRAFVRIGHAPSMVVGPGGIKMGIDALEGL